MTDADLDAAQPDDESFTAGELAQLAAEGIDPATVYKIAGRLFYRQPGVGTEVRFAAADGEPEQTILVPTDQMPGATEDDIRHAAMQYRADLKALEERFSPEQVDGAIAELAASSIFRAVAEMAAAIIRESAVLEITYDPDDEAFAGMTDEQRRRVGERATARMHDVAADLLAGVVLSGENAPDFQRDFTLKLMTESWAWALQDAREIAAELEAQAGDEMSPDAFAELHVRTYQEGTYYTRAVLDHSHQTAAALAELIGRAFQDEPDLGRKLLEAAWRDIQDEDAGQRKPPAPKAPLMRPGFDAVDADGRVWGHVPNDRITHGLTVALQRAADEGWPESPDGRPYTTVAGRGWSVTYSLAPEDFPTIDATWDTMRDLDDDTADTAMVALAHWLANYQRDPVTRLAAITPNDILAQRGTPKHHKGGYRAADKHAVARQMNALGSIWIEGRGFETTETDSKGKKRRVLTTPEGRFLIISSREKQPALTPHTETLYTRFFYRPGDWAYVFMQDGRGAGELARMMQAVLAYDSKRDRYPKRLGRYLTWQFRLRAFSRTWRQPYTVQALLDDAGLSPKQSDYNNPRRFREAIEKALRDLENAHVIGSWGYRELGELPKRNWFDLWLAATLVIEPPQDLRDAYAAIGTRRKALRAPGKDAPKAAS